jgi:hypothetical protein
VAAVPQGIGMFIFGTIYKGKSEGQPFVTIPISMANLLASILRYYLILKIFPLAVEVIAQLVQRWT